MAKVKRGFKFYFSSLIAASALLVGSILSLNEPKINGAYAAAADAETINLRVIGTTDLHGQVNSFDYEQGVDYNNGGLARLYDLMVKTRGELPKENTVTLDAGDILYDYTTEYIFAENQNVIQPIYQAMAKMGYDAITLGNHDFDYGYEYILRQLNGSGLKNIAVVSNVMDSKTGEHPFLENMLITRNMKTASGKSVEIKVGIIGQTIPHLTAKTHSYAGILKTEDFVVNAKAQALKLKEMGADVIIALSHTGIGPENPELNFKNQAYALSKIPEIDVVVSGHEHQIYPTKDMTSPYYKLPNVDKKTFLMNDKNVVMAGDRGEAIGVVDLKLTVNGDKVNIIDRKSEIRMVTETNTKEDKNISSFLDVWKDKLMEYSTDVIGELSSGVSIQNYYGLLGDNTAIQLLNNSKLHYALKFANTTGKAYKDYPIVAASTYASYGVNSVNDFINIRDKITESDLSVIQPYNNYLYIYTVTGKQLREWLEWSASAYETLNSRKTWTNQTMNTLMKEKGLKSLIREEWLDDWSSFFIFDGIDYVIDPSAEPRYDISGNKISNSQRIVSILHDGMAVTDDTKLLLATNKITVPTDANRGIEKQVVLNGFVRSQAVLSKYIEQVSKEGSILPQVDHNWSVKLPEGYRFIVKAPYYAHDLIKNTPWYVDYLTEANQYRYYIASYPKKTGDKESPHIIAAPLVTNATASPFEVAIHACDESMIKLVGYMVGDIDVNYPGWVVSGMRSNTFTVRKNGTYTIYAEDIHGNKTVKKIIIDNFSDNLLGKPTVDSYTNRKSSISGTAEPNATIVFEAYSGIFEGKVGVNGKFSYPLPSQPSGSIVSVYVKDENRGLESERVLVQVKRTGPNQPGINPVYNNAGMISGEINDNDATVIAIIGDNVYVPANGGKDLYLNNTEIYNKSLKVVETQAEILENGVFLLLLPPQEAGEKVTLYSLDHLSRNSRAISTTVIEMGPNTPVVYEISNIEKSLGGYVPDPKGKLYDIYLTIGDHIYMAKTDSKGKFSFTFTDQLQAGQILTVTAYDVKNGLPRTSYPLKVTVKDIESYIRPNSTSLTFNRVTNKSYIISGYSEDIPTVYLAIATGEGNSFMNTLQTVETDFRSIFRHYIDGKLEPGTKLYAMTRFTDGKILSVNITTVVPGKPEMPTLVGNITNTDKKVVVAAEKYNEILLTIGKKTYTSKDYVYDEASGQYLYTFATDRDVSDTPVTIIASTVSGTSPAYKTTIIKAAPDAPKVTAPKIGDKTITGKVELLDYITELSEAATAELSAKLKKAPSEVLKTRTRIFAQIGNKTYEGEITNKGKFTIKVPELKAGSSFKVWGMNKAGRGPLIKVTVPAN